MPRRYILWDHDGVLVDTERWYFVATRDVLQGVGVELSQETYLDYMTRGQSCWDLCRARGMSDDEVSRYRGLRDSIYQEHLRTQAIEVDGVADVLSTLSRSFEMAVVTTARREDFELIHQSRTSRILPIRADGRRLPARQAPPGSLPRRARAPRCPGGSDRRHRGFRPRPSIDSRGGSRLHRGAESVHGVARLQWRVAGGGLHQGGAGDPQRLTRRILNVALRAWPRRRPRAPAHSHPHRGGGESAERLAGGNPAARTGGSPVRSARS